MNLKDSLQKEKGIWDKLITQLWRTELKENQEKQPFILVLFSTSLKAYLSTISVVPALMDLVISSTISHLKNHLFWHATPVASEFESCTS